MALWVVCCWRVGVGWVLGGCWVGVGWVALGGVNQRRMSHRRAASLLLEGLVVVHVTLQDVDDGAEHPLKPVAIQLGDRGRAYCR